MTGDAIDMAVLEELEDTMGADFAADLVATFLDEAPGMLSSLQEAEAAGNADDFRRAAHSIKSNANVFGAAALAEQARSLELDGPQPDATQALVEIYARTETALREFLNAD